MLSIDSWWLLDRCRQRTNRLVLLPIQQTRSLTSLHFSFFCRHSAFCAFSLPFTLMVVKQCEQIQYKLKQVKFSFPSSFNSVSFFLSASVFVHTYSFPLPMTKQLSILNLAIAFKVLFFAIVPKLSKQHNFPLCNVELHC